ncbi:hypothetical protein Tsp_05709 [Trichinella spiralis]|uniref:G-protein coupled receptors family 1 profile domain-containing protein n=1 Tax=Trichinella spiralis TaxID=6334 RepID=E5ST88_TRISP|nr:hypothetical protein Tsp_05709 [Trichinella spiralis]KRY29024.1 hypothetical protein T01_11808 [Trichinella spiralis]
MLQHATEVSQCSATCLRSLNISSSILLLTGDVHCCLITINCVLETYAIYIKSEYNASERSLYLSSLARVPLFLSGIPRIKNTHQFEDALPVVFFTCPSNQIQRRDSFAFRRSRDVTVLALKTSTSASSLMSTTAWRLILASMGVRPLLRFQDLNMHTLLALSLERMTSLCKPSWHNATFTRRKVFSVLLIFICIVCVKVVCILNDVIRRSEIQVDRSCTFFLVFSPAICRMVMFSYMVVIYFTALVYFSTCAVVRFKKRNMATELRSMQLYREASLTRSFGLVLLFLIILQALPLTVILIDRGKTLPAEFTNYTRTIRDIAWLVIPVIYFYSHPDINEQLVKRFPILKTFFSHKQKTAESAVYIGDKSDTKKKPSS